MVNNKDNRVFLSRKCRSDSCPLGALPMFTSFGYRSFIPSYLVNICAFSFSSFKVNEVPSRKSENMAPVMLNSHQLGDMSVRLRHQLFLLPPNRIQSDL